MISLLEFIPFMIACFGRVFKKERDSGITEKRIYELIEEMDPCMVVWFAMNKWAVDEGRDEEEVRRCVNELRMGRIEKKELDGANTCSSDNYSDTSSDSSSSDSLPDELPGYESEKENTAHGRLYPEITLDIDEIQDREEYKTRKNQEETEAEYTAEKKKLQEEQDRLRKKIEEEGAEVIFGEQYAEKRETIISAMKEAEVNRLEKRKRELCKELSAIHEDVLRLRGAGDEEEDKDKKSSEKGENKEEQEIVELNSEEEIDTSDEEMDTSEAANRGEKRHAEDLDSSIIPQPQKRNPDGGVVNVHQSGAWSSPMFYTPEHTSRDGTPAWRTVSNPRSLSTRLKGKSAPRLTTEEVKKRLKKRDEELERYLKSNDIERQTAERHRNERSFYVGLIEQLLQQGPDSAPLMASSRIIEDMAKQAMETGLSEGIRMAVQCAFRDEMGKYVGDITMKIKEELKKENKDVRKEINEIKKKIESGVTVETLKGLVSEEDKKKKKSAEEIKKVAETAVEEVKKMAEKCSAPKMDKQMEKKLEEIKKDIQKVMPKKKTFADLVRENREKRDPEVMKVIIKSNEETESQKVKEIVKENITREGMKINKVDNVKHGVIMEVKTANKTDVIKKIEEGVKGKNLEVRELEEYVPLLKITGVEKELTDEDLLEEIINANLNDTGFTEEDMKKEIKIVRKMAVNFGRYKETTAVIIKTSGRIHDTLMRRGYLYIGWYRCRVEEYQAVMLCLNCGNPGHRTTVCDKPKVCFKCTKEGHVAKGCNAKEFTCINCQQEGKKDVKHSIYSKDCPTYKRELNWQIRKTRWGWREDKKEEEGPTTSK